MDTYQSPFSLRYASSEMLHLFSHDFKILCFRKLWIQLAVAEQKMGLNISSKQIEEMKKNLNKINTQDIEAFEKKFRHDVMANIHAFGKICPTARPIIHLGATSSYVTDNTDLIQAKEGLKLLIQKCAHLLSILSSLAEKEANTPCLGYTHYQVAQPTTIGKRICLWLQDFLFDFMEWEKIDQSLPFLGVKGATGTQSSFLELFDSDFEKVEKMEEMVAKSFGFTSVLPVAGQTYTRKIDLQILNAFASFAASAHKMATDIRLLSHDGEWAESFDKTQVGSSAMPYKKNPIHSERICGIARFVISLSQNPAYTLATQWLERSLDDSSNKRLSTAEAFLGVDSLLNLLIHLSSNMKPNIEVTEERFNASLCHIVTENILMAAVKKGGDRQDLHEKLKRLSFLDSIEKLIDKVSSDESFNLSKKEIVSLCKKEKLIGMAPRQVKLFLKNKVKPKLAKISKPPLKAVEI